ncbi:MAG: hypothetical protein WC617_20050 [Rhodanobacter sp.]
MNIRADSKMVERRPNRSPSRPQTIEPTTVPVSADNASNAAVEALIPYSGACLSARAVFTRRTSRCQRDGQYHHQFPVFATERHTVGHMERKRAAVSLPYSPQLPHPRHQAITGKQYPERYEHHPDPHHVIHRHACEVKMHRRGLHQHWQVRQHSGNQSRTAQPEGCGVVEGGSFRWHRSSRFGV